MSARRNSNRARCQHDGCEKFAQTRGLCKAHGGGSRCRDPSCNKLAQSRGLCIAHGGGRRCQHEGCSKLAQSKGFCISHGGGRRCTVPNCEKFSQVKGRCKSHSKLAEHSDHDGDDGDETESDRMTASPPNLRMREARQQQQQLQLQQLQQQQQSHRSPPLQGAHGEAVPVHRVDFPTTTLPRLHQRRGHDALPLPRSFGLMGASHPQPLLPPRGAMHHQGAYDRAPHDDPTNSHPSRGQPHWDGSHKYEPRSNSGSRSHSDDDLPPLPYTYTLPATRPLFEGLEEKREANDPHHGYTLLPSRFMQSHALPTVSSIMAASASTVTSHAMSTTTTQHAHFVGHRHADPPTTMEPTSIPLLSFLGRPNETKTLPSMHGQGSWTSSSSAATSTTSSAMPSIATASSGVGSSPSLPSIVLPPLKNNNQNPR